MFNLMVIEHKKTFIAFTADTRQNVHIIQY